MYNNNQRAILVSTYRAIGTPPSQTHKSQPALTGGFFYASNTESIGYT